MSFNILSREIWVSALRDYNSRNNNVDATKVIFIAKLKTTIQLFTISLSFWFSLQSAYFNCYYFCNINFYGYLYTVQFNNLLILLYIFLGTYIDFKYQFLSNHF